MKYQPRPGVVLVNVCGVRILIPSRSASVHCKKICELPLIWAMTWTMISQGRPDRDIQRLHQIFTKQSDEETQKSLDDFCRRLETLGFLIPLDPDDRTPS